jgi:hypothetical protein
MTMAMNQVRGTLMTRKRTMRNLTLVDERQGKEAVRFPQWGPIASGASSVSEHVPVHGHHLVSIMDENTTVRSIKECSEIITKASQKYSRR